jgi:nitrogen fixation protein
MLEFLIDNIFVSFAGILFQQVVGIPMVTNCAYMSKNDADEAVSVISLTSSFGGYINVRNSANLELLIDKTSSIYLYVKLKAHR